MKIAQPGSGFGRHLNDTQVSRYKCPGAHVAPITVKPGQLVQVASATDLPEQEVGGFVTKCVATWENN
jgi:hypothetical protein